MGPQVPNLAHRDGEDTERGKGRSCSATVSRRRRGFPLGGDVGEAVGLPPGLHSVDGLVALDERGEGVVAEGLPRESGEYVCC